MVVLQFVGEMSAWREKCESVQVPDSVPQLEEAVQAHQALMDKMAQAYTDVCADGKVLLDTLQTPVSATAYNAITASADFSSGAAHVLDLVHEVRF
jgi:kalirin